MAGDWIKFEMVTPDKPEVFQMAEALAIDPDAVVGKLLRVWSWFDQHSQTGNASVTVIALLDRQTGVAGFCSAMESVGWMARDENGLFLPHFDRHNGKTAKNRALTNRRVAASRKRNAKCNGAGNAAPVTKLVTREEKRREESNTPIVPKGTVGKSAEKSVQLHPLHCRIIRIFTPKSKCDRPRDAAEARAWNRAKGHITEGDVELVEWFYALSKSEQCDATWNRKTAITQLLNQWTGQRDMAADYRESVGIGGSASGTASLEAKYGS